MAKVRLVKRRSAAFWKKTIEEQRQSNVHQSDFCKQRGLSRSTFHRWKARLDDTESTMPEFLPVQVVDQPRHEDDPVLEIVFPHGVRVRVPEQVNAEALKKVLWAVEATRC